MKFSEKFSKLLINNPWKFLISSILVSLIFGIGLTKIQTDFSYRIWFRTSDPLIKTFDDFERRFGNDDTIVVLVESPSGVFDPDSIEIIRKVTEKLWLVPDIIRVDSLTNYQYTHADGDDIVIQDFIPEEYDQEFLNKRKDIALAHEVLPNYLISKDAKISIVYAKIKPFPGGAPDDQLLVDSAKQALSEIKDRGDNTFYINGSTVINNTFREVAFEDAGTMYPITIFLIVAFLIFFFRTIYGVLLPFLLIGLTIIISFGITGFLGIKFNNILTMIPTIIIAIAIADTVHILTTYIQNRKLGQDKYTATYNSFVKNIIPTLLTSVSTAIGFFSLSNSDLIPVADMGTIAGIGTLMAWVLTMTLIAPLLALLPIKVTIPDPEKSESNKKLKSEIYGPKLFEFVSKNRQFIFWSTIAFFIASLWVGLQNEVNSNPYTYFSESVPLRVANDFGLKRLGGVTGPEIVLNTGTPEGIKKSDFLHKVEKFQKWLEEKPYINRVVSIVDIIKSMNRSFHGEKQEYYVIPTDDKAIAELLFLYQMSLPQGMDLNDRITLQNDSLRMSIFWSSQNSKQSLAYKDEFKEKAKEFGLDAVVTGKILIYQGMNTLVVDTFFSSISLAIIGISILLIICFQSFKVGIASMLPNIIPLGFGAAIMAILGKPIDVGSALVTSVCLGIVVDDTIHFLANYNKYISQGLSPEEAIKKVLIYTGPALVTTTLILMVGFGIMVFANFLPNVNFGILSALVLFVALIADIIFLPAMLLLNKKG